MKPFFIFLFFIYGVNYSLDVHLKVLDNRKWLRIEADGGVYVQENKKEVLMPSCMIKKNTDNQKIFVRPFRQNVALKIYSDIPEKSYQGTLEISITNNKFFAINHVQEEDYLASVVGSEMEEGFPAEAMKSQAVAARTALYYSLYRKKDKIISDLSSDYQAYRGTKFAFESARNAVMKTSGEVMTFRKQLFFPYYHSTCGGVIYPASKDNGLAMNIYTGVNAPKSDSIDGNLNCRESPYFYWRREMSFKDLEKGTGLKNIRSISIVKSKDGYVKNLVLDNGNTTIIPAYKFLSQMWLNGIHGLKSLNFDLKTHDSQIVFNGKGFGHHVGMCQWGARGLAKKNWPYKKILPFYYPGVQIGRIRGN
jgi:stage II sporulation protein D